MSDQHDPIYRDLRGTPELSLFEKLTTLAPKAPEANAEAKTRHQAENQLTAAVAWLADHSPRFARSLCDLMLRDDDNEARDAIQGATLRADVWVRLPPIETERGLYPDLSITAPERAFQLLVEVKLGSPFGNDYYVPRLDRQGWQTEAYLYSWRHRCCECREAKERRLGTITRDGKGPEGERPDQWRADNVRWACIRTLLEDELEENVKLVAKDLHDYLGCWVLPMELPSRFDDDKGAFLDWGKDLTGGVCNRLEKLNEHFKCKPPRKGHAGVEDKDPYYVSCSLKIEPDTDKWGLRFRVMPEHAPRGGLRDNASFQIAVDVPGRDVTPEALERLKAAPAGLERTATRTIWIHRIAIPLAEFHDKKLEDQIDHVADRAEGLLRDARYVD